MDQFVTKCKKKKNLVTKLKNHEYYSRKVKFCTAMVRNETQRKTKTYSKKRSTFFGISIVIR